MAQDNYATAPDDDMVPSELFDRMHSIAGDTYRGTHPIIRFRLRCGDLVDARVITANQLRHPECDSTVTLTLEYYGPITVELNPLNLDVNEDEPKAVSDAGVAIASRTGDTDPGITVELRLANAVRDVHQPLVDHVTSVIRLSHREPPQ